jgi:hypothetical protein
MHREVAASQPTTAALQGWRFDVTYGRYRLGFVDKRGVSSWHRSLTVAAFRDGRDRRCVTHESARVGGCRSMTSSVAWLDRRVSGALRWAADYTLPEGSAGCSRATRGARGDLHDWGMGRWSS